MKLPSPFAAKPRTADQCRVELVRLEAERTAVAEQLQAMVTERVELLGDDSVPVERLLDHDARAAQLAIRRDRMAIQAERLEAERQAAEAREEAERRQRLHDTGRVAEKARRKLLEGEYLAAARRVAEIVARADELMVTIDAANKALPEGAEPVGSGEVFNGVEYRSGFYEEMPPDRWLCELNGARITRSFTAADAAAYGRTVREFPVEPVYRHAVIAQAHRPVLQGLQLPGIAPGEPAIASVPAPADA